MALTINVTNASSDQWTRSNWKCAAGISDTPGTVDDVVSTPSETLRKGSGFTKACAEMSMLEWIAQDALYISVGYTSDKDPSAVFAVRIGQNFQLFSMGKGVTFMYFKDGIWHDADQDSSQITWNFSKYVVTASPKLEHQEGAVDVLITDKLPNPKTP